MDHIKATCNREKQVVFLCYGCMHSITEVDLHKNHMGLQATGTEDSRHEETTRHSLEQLSRTFRESEEINRKQVAVEEEEG